MLGLKWMKCLTHLTNGDNWTCLEIGKWTSHEQKDLGKQICENTSITESVKGEAEVLSPLSVQWFDEDDETVEERKLLRGKRRKDSLFNRSRLDSHWALCSEKVTFNTWQVAFWFELPNSS